MNSEKLGLFFDKACAISVYILLLSIPISTTLVELFFGFALLFFIGRLFTSRDLFVQLLNREKIITFFFISLALSLVNSGTLLPISLKSLFLKWGEYILLYLIVSQTFTDTRRIKYALAVISSGAALVILDSYSQLFFNLEFLRHRNMILHSNIFALTGPFKHNTGLSAYLVCVLLIMLYWVFSKEMRGIKPAAIVVFFAGVLILPFTYSRGGWVSFMAAIILLAVLMKKFNFLGFALLFTVILGLKFSVLKFLIFKDSGRFELWDISLRMIREHPLLGNGIGTFMALFRSFSPTGDIKYAHNCFLQLWAEAGIIALAAFILFIIKTLNKGLVLYKKTKDSVFVILVCAITAYLCHSFFDTHLFSLQLAVLFWVLMGLLKGSIASIGRWGCTY